MSTPREFCRASLEVLRLPGAALQPTSIPYELLLLTFSSEDLATDTFERQLWLLAKVDASSCFGEAAARLLDAWCAERDRAQHLTSRLHVN